MVKADCTSGCTISFITEFTTFLEVYKISPSPKSEKAGKFVLRYLFNTALSFEAVVRTESQINVLL